MKVIVLKNKQKDTRTTLYVTICKRWLRIEENFSFFYEEGRYWEDCGTNVIDGAKIKRPISRVLQDLPEEQAIKKIAELKLLNKENIKYLMSFKVA